MKVVARAPGRVNLIGDHTDYTDGLCFPMAIDRSVTISGDRVSEAASVHLDSPGLDPADVPLDVSAPAAVSPAWARYVAGVVAQLHPSAGFRGIVESTVPQGAGLSSSAALEVAVALVLGADLGDGVGLARLCQAAEHAATGVPTGVLDQLASIGGVAGHGLLLDCRRLTIEPVLLPPASEVEWVVVHTGSRSLAASQYSTRVEELARAAAAIGPIRDATLADIDRLDDPVLRSRVRHVVTENVRVEAFAAAVARGDVTAAGELMTESHRSLTTEYDSSTPEIDELCRRLDGTAGVLGSRITGGGWGGCVVALARPGALDPSDFASAWTVQPAAGASIDGAVN